MLPASIIPFSCQQAYNNHFCPAYLHFLQSVSRILYVWDMHKSPSGSISQGQKEKLYEIPGGLFPP